MEKVSPDRVIQILKQISTSHFGGKPNGRFKISYQRMQQITGVIIINDDFVRLLTEQCLKYGISLINLGNEFAVMNLTILTGFRNVPQSVIEKVITKK